MPGSFALPIQPTQLWIRRYNTLTSTSTTTSSPIVAQGAIRRLMAFVRTITLCLVMLAVFVTLNLIKSRRVRRTRQQQQSTQIAVTPPSPTSSLPSPYAFTNGYSSTAGFVASVMAPPTRPASPAEVYDYLHSLAPNSNDVIEQASSQEEQLDQPPLGDLELLTITGFQPHSCRHSVPLLTFEYQCSNIW